LKSTGSSMSERGLFLATTAREDFWDKERKILFLGEWCRLYDRREEINGLVHEDMPFYWENNDEILRAYRYCAAIYEKYLEEITFQLNRIHGLNKDTRYYRIVLGYWLFDFIQQAYDKYCTLKSAQDRYRDLETWTLDPGEYRRPFGYNDFVINVIDDEYALQIYSQIIPYLGIRYEPRPTKATRVCEMDTGGARRRVRNALKDVFTATNYLVNRLWQKKRVIVTDPYFGGQQYRRTIELIWRSRFQCIYDAMIYPVEVPQDLPESGKEQLEIRIADTEFERVLSDLVNRNVPRLYSTHLNLFREKVLKLPPAHGDAYFSANALYSNEIYKFLAAENHGQSKLLTMQHGGGYGYYKTNTSEDWERSVSDVFYTWGWTGGVNTQYITPSKLGRRNAESSPGERGKGVLFVSNTGSRYVRQLSVPSIMARDVKDKFIGETIRFLTSVDRTTDLAIRLHPSREYRWFEKERIIDAGVAFSFDDHKKRIDKALEDALIVVCDNLITSFLESLAMGKPTIAFMHPKFLDFRESARDSFEKLRLAGILHDSGKAAAEHLNRVYRDVQAWWGRDDVRNARRDFVHTYARQSENWADEWVREFRRIVANG
jgi:putative transferase (TIGR04331 family)